MLGVINQHVAAMALGVDQPRMSDVMHGRLGRFSLSKLIRLLAGIDHRVVVQIINDGSPDFRPFAVIRRRHLSRATANAASDRHSRPAASSARGADRTPSPPSSPRDGARLDW
ncbi:MAG: XRE family transcriptional regulator [Geodermatophilaceae bacterium]|nr:XRE family transcriptional regulator [Geodermatophilaceae bacterium]